MRSWPHAPIHILNEKGTYIVTGATYNKEHFFKEPTHLNDLQETLLELADKYQWHLEAWAIFSNHYHFIAQSPDHPITLRKFINHFHSSTSRRLNEEQQLPNRKVWYQFWDTKITYQRSYLARLNYVMQNPVKHQLVNCPTLYPWCSAAWFKRNVTTARWKTVMAVKTDSVNIHDEF